MIGNLARTSSLILLTCAGLALVAWIAVMLSGRAASPVAAVAEPPSAAPIVEAAPEGVDPETLATRRLTLQPGGRCQAALTAYLVPLPAGLDDLIAEAGGPGNWLRKDVWIGDANSAASAFSATWGSLSHEGNSMWIETVRDGKPTSLFLRATKSAKGDTVWRVAGSARVAPCSSDGE